jgi:hypothetical protein
LTEHPEAPKGVDTLTPSIARIYDYHLGGTHNYPVDREAAENVTRDLPTFPAILRENRAFLRRAARYLAEQEVGYFLDLGAGIPTVDNVHEIVQEVNPGARVVYVDNDSVAIAHSREILAGNDRAAAVQADLRDPAVVLADPQVERLLLLELGEPIAVILSAVLHFIPDDAEASALIAAYRDAMPPGSYLAVSHGAREQESEPQTARAAETYSRTVAAFRLRTPEELRGLLTGFEIVDPGVVYCSQWRPDPDAPEQTGPPLPQICAVGRKLDV